MNANELMIGDWVQIPESTFLDTKYPVRVVLVNEYGYVELFDGSGDFGHNINEGVEPIPLTPEILEKNGFVKVPHEYEYPECQCWTNDVDGNYSFEIVTDEHRKPYILGNGDMGDYEWVNFECKYVHELQHALRLAGINKEIVL